MASQDEHAAATMIQKNYRGARERARILFGVGSKSPSGNVWIKAGGSAGVDVGIAGKETTTKLTHLNEVAAALAIQRALRGKEGRERAKTLRLWKAWNALDTKEESELVHTHGSYEELKLTYADTTEKPVQPPKHTGAHGQRLNRSHPLLNVGTSLPAVHGDEPTRMEHNVPRLPDVITLDFVTAMMDHFKHENLLMIEDVLSLIHQAKKLLDAHENVVKVQVHTRLTVVGDIHGQLDDLFSIFKLNGLPSLRNAYLFNGDFVDRGQNSVECILVLLAFKVLYPNHFFLNRGNHEARDINSRDGFEKECLHKYGYEVFDAFSACFACLPLATTINDTVFVVHGGLCWDDLTIDDMNELDRRHEIPPVDSYLEQMIWSDPQEKPGRDDNPRGASVVFGPDVVDDFLRQNNMSMIIRSHECQTNGYQKMFGDKLITVFSASNYCGVVGNDGAFIIFDKNTKYRVVQFCAKPKEKMSRYRMRHAMLENDVISKLLRRIAENRLALVDYYSKLDPESNGAITRVQWAEGLKAVLGIDIPFLEFQSYLGLPKLGVTGTEEGRVDYMNFLDRYRISLKFDSPALKSPTPGTPPADAKSESGEQKESSQEAPESVNTPRKSMELLAQLLFKHRFELESLFRYFDADGDGEISLVELREGVLSLRAMLKFQLSNSEVDEIIQYMDKNSDGVVAFDEFFDSFEVVDEELGQVLKKGREHKQLRRQFKGSKTNIHTKDAITFGLESNR